MMRTGTLVLYRNKPAFVADLAGDRMTLKLEDGATQSVREKDVSILHQGPVDRLPLPADGGDFETARAMLASGSGDTSGAGPLSWKEMAELVFGGSGPAEIIACLRAASAGTLFRMAEGFPVALGDVESAAALARLGEKESEAARREAFVARAKKTELGPEDGRFISELESFAFGKTAKCRLAKDIGLSETPESVHAFLLKTGIWDESVNPWPQRAGCPLSPPKIDLPETPPFTAFADSSRIDLTAIEALAIDNEGSQDPDDAIACDGDRIWIHVADPASIVAPGSPVDAEALARGATLYLPERIVPMLPEAAVPRFGLGLAATSPALSFSVRLAPDGSIDDTEIFPSIVRVRRMTYAEADAALEASDPMLTALDRAAALRASRRAANGAVEIDIPEVSHRVRDGVVSIRAYPPSRASAVVREMMLLAGEAVARWAFSRNLPFPYYGQEAPQLGESVRTDPETGKAPLSVQFARRRGMKAGMLGPTPGAHRGLGLPFYSQVTSPLRRYQDLLAHMQIRASLASTATVGGSGSGGAAPVAAPAILDADEISRRCAAAGAAISPNRQAERDSESFWTAVFLQRNPDWHGDGIVVSVSERDTALYIPSLGMETRIRTRTGLAPDDTVALQTARVSIVGPEIAFEPAPPA